MNDFISCLASIVCGIPLLGYIQCNHFKENIKDGRVLLNTGHFQMSFSRFSFSPLHISISFTAIPRWLIYKWNILVETSNIILTSSCQIMRVSTSWSFCHFQTILPSVIVQSCAFLTLCNILYHIFGHFLRFKRYQIFIKFGKNHKPSGLLNLWMNAFFSFQTASFTSVSAINRPWMCTFLSTLVYILLKIW